MRRKDIQGMLKIAADKNDLALQRLDDNPKPLISFFEAYHWLDEHPIFKEPKYKISRFQDSLVIMVVKVNPETDRIEDDQALNTATRVWLEHGPFGITTVEEHGIAGAACSHDLDLDCGGTTFEEAIIELAALVLKHYGDYDAEAIANQEWKEFSDKHGIKEGDSPQKIAEKLFGIKA